MDFQNGHSNVAKIAFGGGCHWCTEAVFQSLRGVEKVEQGFVSSNGDNASFSEAVIVHYHSNEISLQVLTEIHLRTHKSMSNHSMRDKYRSAIYTYNKAQSAAAEQILSELQPLFQKRIITQVIDFVEFKPSDEQFHNYYQSNPEKPFCKTYIEPKLSMLMQSFGSNMKG